LDIVQVPFQFFQQTTYFFVFFFLSGFFYFFADLTDFFEPIAFSRSFNLRIMSFFGICDLGEIDI
jgi:hypothetical protein